MPGSKFMKTIVEQARRETKGFFVRAKKSTIQNDLQHNERL